MRPVLAFVAAFALLWAGATCAQLPREGEETGLAIDPCVKTTPPTYVYVEPNIVTSQAINLARGSTGGHTVMAADGNTAVYLVNEENQTDYPSSQIFYRSDDGGVTWDQRGALRFLNNQCASTLVALPRIYGDGTQHRLVFVETACDTGPSPGGAGSNCSASTFLSDDGGSIWTQAGNATFSFTTDYCSSALAVDDVGVVHFVYSANGVSNPNALLHNVSSDGGQSWGANNKIATVSTTPRWPSIAATGPVGKHQMVVAYELTEPDANHRWAVGAIATSDNGATWSTPKEAVSPLGNEMLSAPNFTAIDANTVVATYYHTAGDHNSATSTDVGLTFGAVQVKDTPLFGKRFSLGTIATFPPTVVAVSRDTLIVAVQHASSTGPTLMRLTLKR